MTDKIFLIEKFNFWIKLKLFFNSNKSRDMQCIFVNYQLTDYRDKKEPPNYLKNIELSKYENESISFKSNRLTLDILKNITVNNPFFNFVKHKVDDKRIIYAAKKSILNDLEQKVRFYNLYKFLKKKYPKKKIIKYEQLIDYCNVAKKMEVIKDNDFVPKATSITNSVIYSFIYMPVWFLSLIFRNGIHLHKNPESLRIVQHLANGFDVEGEKKFKKSRLDNLLYDNINSRYQMSFAFVFSNWDFGRKQTSNIKNYLNNRKIKYIFEYQNSVSFKYFIKQILTDYFRIILINFRNIFSDINNVSYCLPTLRLIKNIHETEIFLQHYRPRVFFGRDDYNASHIIKTIILNKYNCKHVGFHHSAFLHPHISTLLTYTCFNVYYMAGIKYLDELYRDYWFSDTHEIVGQPYLDYILSAKNNPKIQGKLAAFFKNEINILFGIPTIGGTSLFDDISNIKIKFSKILNIFNKHKNINLIFRCRTYEDTLKLRKIISYDPDTHKNVFLITNEFNTYELISYVDIIVGSDTSSLLLEALSLKDKIIIPYNVRFSSKKELLWYKYNYPYLCDNLIELEETISKLIADDLNISHSNSIEQIVDGFSFPRDGKTWKKVADSVIECSKL